MKKNKKIPEQYSKPKTKPIKQNGPGPWDDFRFPMKDFAVAGIIFFALFVIYLLCKCKLHFFDALMYAAIVEMKEPNWQRQLGWANHLSFNYYGHAFWYILKHIGLERGGYIALEIMNSMFGALTSSIFFLWLTKFIEKRWLSIIFSLFFGLSFVVWYRSTDAQVYPSLVFHMVVSMFIAWSYARTASFVKLCLLAISLGLAVLSHQFGLFVIPAGIVAIIIQKKKRKLFSRLFTFMLLGSIVVGVPYLYTLFVQEKLFTGADGHYEITKERINTAHMWLLGNAGDYDPNTPGIQNPFFKKGHSVKDIAEHIVTMVNCVVYTKDGSYSSPGEDFGKYWIREYPFQRDLSKILFFGIGIFLFLKLKVWKTQPVLFKILFAWVIVSAVLIIWLFPPAYDYSYHLLVPWFFVIALGIQEFIKSETFVQQKWIKTGILGAFFFSMGLIPINNFVSGIYPRLLDNCDGAYVRAMWIKKHTKKGGVIIISGTGWSNAQKVWTPAFAGIARLSFDLTFVYNTRMQGLRVLKDQIEMISSQGMNLYALDEIFGKGTEQALKENWNVSMDEIKEIFKPYEFKVLSVFEPDGCGVKIMQVFPKKGSAAYQRREGIKYYNEKNYAMSAESFLKVPQDRKTSFDYKLMGNCFMLLNDRTNAVSCWKNGYALNPSDDQLRQIIQQYGK